jgi:hypothetical protein
MPGIVKAFIERLESLAGRAGNPSIAFLVQSGFPESMHSRHIERYLEKLAARLGSNYVGSIIKGGCEGVRMMPEQMNRKLFDRLFEIGNSIAKTGYIDTSKLTELAEPERYPAVLIPIFKALALTPLLNFYWNSQLKQNGVYEQRFARPYV